MCRKRLQNRHRVARGAYTAGELERICDEKKLPSISCIAALGQLLEIEEFTQRQAEQRQNAADFEALKERLSRARSKDTTLDDAQRRSFEVAVEPTRKATEREPGRGKEQALDAIQREVSLTARGFVCFYLDCTRSDANLEELFGGACREQMHPARDDSGPSGLMTGSNSSSVVTVKVFIE